MPLLKSPGLRPVSVASLEHKTCKAPLMCPVHSPLHPQPAEGAAHLSSIGIFLCPSLWVSISQKPFPSAWRPKAGSYILLLIAMRGSPCQVCVVFLGVWAESSNEKQLCAQSSSSDLRVWVGPCLLCALWPPCTQHSALFSQGQRLTPGTHTRSPQRTRRTMAGLLLPSEKRDLGRV